MLVVAPDGSPIAGTAAAAAATATGGGAQRVEALPELEAYDIAAKRETCAHRGD